MITITPAHPSCIPALGDIAITLFDTMLQLPVILREPEDQGPGYELTAAVGYGGSGRGGVLLECHTEQARDWCSRLCCLPPPVALDDARDGLGELCNILAGNLKPLLPPGSTLATPLVWEGRTEHRIFAGCDIAGVIELVDRGSSFRVSLFLG